MKRSRSTAAALTALLLAPRAFASGYEFEGVGTRQVSRAGAATADSDDWTAGYWNPASLPRAARGGREFGAEAFGGWAYARDSNSLSTLPGIGAIFKKDRQVSASALGALGLVTALGEDAAGGLIVYTPLGQGAQFKDVSPGGTAVELNSYAGIVVINGSVGTKVSDTVSLGAGLGLLYGRIGTDTAFVNPPLLPGDSLTSHLSGEGWGVEGTLGARWDPVPAWTFAAVYRTGADVDISGHATASSKFLGYEASDFRYSLRQPPTADFGTAWRPAPGWTFTADMHNTYWKRFTGMIHYSRPGSLITNSAETLHWRDTWKLRFGLKRELGEKTELFAGYSYDKPAVDQGSVDFATAVDVPMHRVSLGAARWLSKTLQVSLGGVGGYGERREGAVRYELTGFQVMGEGRLRF